MSHHDPLLDHNYDGIQELDNPLPRWWVYLFYLTIIFAIGYSSYYWFLGGPSSAQELDQKMAQYQPKSSSSGPNPALAIPELAKKPEIMAVGKQIFETRCVSCHGPQGGGLIGPNLTDHFWIHGKGTAADIYKVVFDGVPDKGMITWGTQLKVSDIQAVVVYVMSLKDSNPPNAKGPQGEEVHP